MSRYEFVSFHVIDFIISLSEILASIELVQLDDVLH